MDKEELRRKKREYYWRNPKLMRNRAKKQRERIKLDPILLENRRLYHREYWEKLRRELIIAMGSLCFDCGYNEYIEILEIHHLNPFSKRYKDSCEKEMLEYHKTKIIPKGVILLCPTHHAVRHLKERLQVK